MNDREEYRCGGAYRAMLKLFREAKVEMEKENIFLNLNTNVLDAKI